MISLESAVASASAANIVNVVWRDEVDSTQRLANDLLDEGRLGDLPALVITAVQTAGRGRGGNRWWSQGDDLTFSLVVDSRQMGLTANELSAAGIATAAGICNAVDKLGNASAMIKWPNDVYIGGGKLSGLLVDSRQNVLVIGVGVNLNQRPCNAPMGVADGSISLAECLGQNVEAAPVLSCVLAEIAQSLDDLAVDVSTQHAQWNIRSLLNDRHVTIKSAAGDVGGTVIEIESTGALRIKTNRGEIKRVVSGVVDDIVPPIRTTDCE